MLSEAQARFVENYFHDVGRIVSAEAVGSADWEDIRRALKDNAVRHVISAVWGAILDHVAVHGHQIHGLPKQGEKQAGIRVEVRR
jgi:hypothetical protein